MSRDGVHCLLTHMRLVGALLLGLVERVDAPLLVWGM
jgi:hypothetical protein